MKRLILLFGSILMCCIKPIEVFAQNDSILLLNADKAYFSKQFNESLGICNEVISRNPKNAKAYYIKAKCRLEQKLYIDVFTEINKAISYHPCYAEAFALKAETHFILKDYRQARKFYYQALACNNKEAVYYFNIGILETKIYKWNSAIENFGKAMKYDPENSDARENRAYAYSMIGEHQLAIIDYDSVLAKNPKRDDLFIKRGMSMLGLKQFKEAIPIFSRAIRLNPNNPHAYYGRGRALFELKRFVQALPDFDTAIILKPDFETAIFTHAVTLLEIDAKENKTQACEEFKQSAKLGFGNSWDYIRKYCEY